MFWEPTTRERKRRRVLGVVCVGIALWSCADTDAYLGDIPKNPPLTTADASAGADVGAVDVLMCVATECPEGLTTCASDYGPTYKCSVDLRRDPKHCGACGKECLSFETINMTSRCIEGACVLECVSIPRYVFPDAELPTNYQNCNGLLDDGCEVDLFWNEENCGACGNACPAGKRCIAGQCGCPGDLKDCNEFCIDVSENDHNCGGCGIECQPPDNPCDPMPEHAGYGCKGGECEKLKCEFGFADCDGDLGLECGSNGCETSLVDPNNCGACGRACKQGEECRIEDSGIDCFPTCADAGLATCPDGRCADTLNNPGDCGGCGLVCPSGGPNSRRSCKKGVCEVVCAEGFGDCNGDPTDGCETDLRVHPSHCGACGVSCDLSLGQPCIEGKCLLMPCEEGEAR